MAEARPPSSPPRAVPASAVTIDDAFWAPRLGTFLDVTLPHVMQQCEDTGRLRNFDRAAGSRSDAFEGRVYDDSDVYKVLEGAAYALALRPDEALRARVESWVSRIAAAQRPDGYVHTWHQTHSEAVLFDDVQSKHELYCAGHLLEAGLALFEAIEDRALLDVALRFVAHIGTRFGPAGPPPGHPEIELALLRLHAATGDVRALELARQFLERRGHARDRASYGEYAQDHAPIRDQREAVGHAVRALYLYAAVADLVAATGDDSWRPALDAVWTDLVDRKMFVTGGLGSSTENEGFTEPYDLVDEDAYAETCAAIGLVFLARRLSLLHDDGRYVDVLERALFNGVLPGISLEGDRFFYTNPLASRSEDEHVRKPFFECACCPSNLARFLPSVGGLLYAQDEHGIRVDLYAAGRATIGDVTLRQVTGYPWAGGVRLELELPEPRSFSLRLRIPGWCTHFRLRVGGRVVKVKPVRGYAVLRRTWAAGDVVDLDLAMPAERERANEHVVSSRGRVALRRGPLLYCVEGIDHGGHVHDLVLSPTAPLEAIIRPRLLGGLITLAGEARREGRPTLLEAVPCFAWQNRGAGEMRVWIPETPEALPHDEGVT